MFRTEAHGCKDGSFCEMVGEALSSWAQLRGWEVRQPAASPSGSRAPLVLL